jgi:uncharacterized protein involved in outer membrane biogenesis
MPKLLRTVLIIIVSILALGTIAAIILVNTLSTDQLKAQITKAVKNATGRNFTVQGELHWKLLPRLQLELQDAVLDNPAGFGPAPFLRVQSIAADVELLPLLHHQIHVGSIKLSGADVNLQAKDKEHNNWQDMLTKTATQSVTTVPTAANNTSSESGLKIQHLELQHVNVNYQSPGQVFSAKDLNYQGMLEVEGKPHASGKSEVSELRFNKLALHAVKTNLEFKNGELILMTTHSQFFEGSLTGKINLHQERGHWVMTANETLQKVNAVALLNALGKDNLTAGTLSARFQGNSEDVASLPASLSGKGEIKLADVRAEQDTLSHSINQVLTITQLKNLSDERTENTLFKHFSTGFRIKHGVITTENLILHAPRFTITGESTINLNTKRLAGELIAALATKPEAESKNPLQIVMNEFHQTFKDLGGIPLSISGTLDAPKIRPRMDLIAPHLTDEIVYHAKDQFKKLAPLLKADNIKKLFKL